MKIGEYSKEIVELEKYLLNMVLEWELSFATPSDYIQVIIHAVREENALFNADAEDIRKRALQISDLLLMCKYPIIVIAYDTISTNTITSISFASLYAALYIVNKVEYSYLFTAFVPEQYKVSLTKVLIDGSGGIIEKVRIRAESDNRFCF